MYRSKMRRGTDRKVFRKTAIRTAKINARTSVPRGGIRL